MRGRQREITDRKGEGNVTREVEIGVMQPQGKKRPPPPQGGGDEEQVLPQRGQWDHGSAHTLISHFQPPEL